MPNRLFVDEILSVGMVKAGDNPDAEVVIYKSKPSDVSKMTASVENAPTEPGVRMDLSAITDEDLRKSIEATIAEKDDQISDLTSQVDKAEADPTEDASDEVKAILKERDDQLADLRKDLDAAVTKARVEEYIVKAEPFAGLLGSPKEIGPVLADLAFKAPESFTILVNALTAASQREEMGKLFSTLGTSEGEGESDPVTQRDVWVKEHQKDGETVSQTNARFWKENPEAVKESRE